MRVLPIALLGLAVAACTPNDVTLGGAFRHDIAMQTIEIGRASCRERV